MRGMARADDGLPEALEAPALPYVVGVQWHPEELARTEQTSANLFYDFIKAAAGPWRSQAPDGWTNQFRAGCAALANGTGHAATNGDGSNGVSGSGAGRDAASDFVVQLETSPPRPPPRARHGASPRRRHARCEAFSACGGLWDG